MRSEAVLAGAVALTLTCVQLELPVTGGVEPTSVVSAAPVPSRNWISMYAFPPASTVWIHPVTV